MKNPSYLIDSLIENGNLRHRNEQVISKFIVEYYKEMNQVEKQFKLKRGKEDDEKYVFDGIAAKRKVHRKFWTGNDPYWRPCSLSSDERYKPSSIVSITILCDGRTDYIAFVELKTKRVAYHIKPVKGKPRISNEWF